MTRSHTPSTALPPDSSDAAGFTPYPEWFGEGRLPVFLAIYFGAHVLIRVSISGTLALDEAEQVLLSQWFQWGYSGQPPLYAWTQHLVFEFLGTNLFALALLKNGLLFLAYYFFWLTARRLWPDRPGLVTLAVLSWLLIPQIVWEAQRDLSHSVLVLTLASASLYSVARALMPGMSEGDQPGSGPGMLWYVAYGALMGLGMLSKYNFVVFAGALNLALLSLPEGRALLLNPRILVALTCAVAIAFPHFTWAFVHWDVAVRSLSKVEASAQNNRLVGLGVLALSGVSFLTPLWLAWLGLFPGLFRRSDARRETVLCRLVQRYLIVLVLGLVLGVLALGIGHVKERWMIPFLFLVPLFFFSGAGGAPLNRRKARWFRRLALAAAALTLLISGFRALLGPTLGATTRVNYPFDDVAAELERGGFRGGYLLAHNAWFAGNLLRRFPGARAYVPGFVLPDPDVGSGQTVLAVWDAVRSEGLPEEMREDLAGRFGLDPAGAEPMYSVFPYNFGAGRETRIGYLWLGPSGSPRPGGDPGPPSS
jgi:hypothetical protein